MCARVPLAPVLISNENAMVIFSHRQSLYSSICVTAQKPMPFRFTRIDLFINVEEDQTLLLLREEIKILGRLVLHFSPLLYECWL